MYTLNITDGATGVLDLRPIANVSIMMDRHLAVFAYNLPFLCGADDT